MLNDQSDGDDQISVVLLSSNNTRFAYYRTIYVRIVNSSPDRLPTYSPGFCLTMLIMMSPPL